MKDLLFQTEELNILLEDEDLTDEKLKKASEGLLPNLATELNNLFRGNRFAVYKAIDSERDFQDKLTADPNRPDMIDVLHMGDALTAIKYNLDKAIETWYRDAIPYQNTLEYLRKIAALIVRQAEVHGIPERKI